jgi:hypothetical protein
LPDINLKLRITLTIRKINRFDALPNQILRFSAQKGFEENWDRQAPAWRVRAKLELDGPGGHSPHTGKLPKAHFFSLTSKLRQSHRKWLILRLRRDFGPSKSL